MNKELTLAEKFHKAWTKLYADDETREFLITGEDCKVMDEVETALKDYEQLKIVAKPLTDEEKKSINSVVRRLKALEIFCECLKGGIKLIDNAYANNKFYSPYRLRIGFEEWFLKNKEEFDLLKEVLK